jgi:acetyltransferase EpsM
MSIALVGSGGHARVICDILELSNREIIGFYDDNLNANLYNYPRLGDIEYLTLNPPDAQLIIAIGDNRLRASLTTKLTHNDFATAFHPTASISPHSVIGPGTVLMANASVNPGTTISSHCIINTNASVDHDCHLGDFVHISPGANLAGGVTIGVGTHIGVGAAILPMRVIGDWVTIGGGSVVTHDITSSTIAMGNPAKPQGRA